MLAGLKYALRLTHGTLRELYKTVSRSPKWSSVRDTYLYRHQTCAACGTRQHLNVHHIIPFHLDESKELDEKNLITLCLTRNLCHIKIGHGDDYKAYNPEVIKDAAYVLANPDKRKMVEQRVMKFRKYIEGGKP